MSDHEIVDDDPFGGLDLGSDLEGSPEQTTNDRNPAVQAVGVANTTFRSNALNNERNLAAIRDALPSGFNSTINTADEMVSGTERIYNDATKKIQGPLRDLAMATRRLTPRIRNILPESTADKLDGWLDRYIEDSDSSGSRTPTQEEMDNQLVQGQTNSIFAKFMQAQAEGEAQKDAEGAVKKVIDDQVQTRRHNDNRNVQLQLLQIASDEQDYRNSVLWRYQKESLELSYRSFFAQRDLLENFKQYAINANTALAAIQKNTGLPEAQKVNLSEQYREQSQALLFGKAHEAMSGKFGNVGKRILNKLGVKASEIADTVAGGLQDAAGMASMLADQNDAEVDAGMSDGSVSPITMITELVTNQQVGRGREYLTKELGKIFRENPELAKWNNRLQNLNNNGDELLQMIRDDATGEDLNWWQKGLRSFTDFIELEDIRDHSTTPNNNLLEDATKAVHWGLLERRTLIEIIPGILTRQLQQLEILNTGDDSVELLTWSNQREALVRESTAVSDTRSAVMSESDVESLGSSIKEAINEIDKDNKLTPEAKMTLGRELLSDVRKGHTFNPLRMVDAGSYAPDTDSSIVEEISNLMASRYKVDTIVGEYDNPDASSEANLIKARNYVSGIRGNLLDYQTGINKFSSVGQKDLLRKAGFLKNTVKGDEFIDANQDLQTERAIYAAIDKQYDDEIGENGIVGPQLPPELLAERQRLAAEIRLSTLTEEVVNENTDSHITTPSNNIDVSNISNVNEVINTTDVNNVTGDNNVTDVTEVTEPSNVNQTNGSSNGWSNIVFPSAYPLPDNQLNLLINSLNLDSTAFVSNNTDNKIFDDIFDQTVKIAEHTSNLENLLNYLDVPEGGIIRRGLVGGVSGLWAGAKSIGRGVGNIGGFGLDTVAATRDIVGSWLRRSPSTGSSNTTNTESSNNDKDLYIRGRWTPILRASLLRAGKYFKADTGEVLTSWDEIDGPIKDADGNIVLNEQEATGELYNRDGDNIVLKGLKAVAGAPFKLMSLYGNLPMTILRGANTGWNRLINRMNRGRNAYNQDGEMRLEYSRMVMGEYFDQTTGKVIKTWDDINGAVVDRNGEIVFTAKEALDGVFDSEGKAIKLASAMNFLTSGVKKVFKISGTVAKAMKRVTEDLYSGLTTGVKTLWGKVFGENVNQEQTKIVAKDVKIKALNVYINGGRIHGGVNSQGSTGGSINTGGGDTHGSVSNVENVIDNAVNTVTNSEVVNNVVDNARDMVNSISENETVSNTINTVQETFNNVTNSNLATDARELIKPKGDIEERYNAIKEEVNFVGPKLPKRENSIVSTLDRVTETLTTVHNNAKEALEKSNDFENKYNEIKASSRFVGPIAPNGFEKVKTNITDTYNSVSEYVSNSDLVNEVTKSTTTQSEVLKDIYTSLNNTETNYYHIRKMVEEGNTDALSENALKSARIDRAKDLISGVKDNVVNKLGPDYSELFNFDKANNGEYTGPVGVTDMLESINPEVYERLFEKAKKDGKDLNELDSELLDIFNDAITNGSVLSEESLTTLKELDTNVTDKLDDVISAIKEMVPTTVINDQDGDGDRDNGYKDIKERYASARENAKKMTEGNNNNNNTNNNSTSAGLFGAGGMLSMLGGIKDSLVTGFTTLATLWGGSKVTDVLTGGGPPGGGPSKAGKAWKVAKTVGKALVTPLLWAGRAAIGIVGAKAAIIAAAVVGTAYLTYKGAKYIGRRVDTEPLERLRFVQYGFDTQDSKYLVALRYLEEFLVDEVSYDEAGISSVNISALEVFEEVAEDFGLKATQEDYNNWRIWYLQRFIPVFTTNLTWARIMSSGESDGRATFTFGNLDLRDIDDEIKDEAKAEFIERTVYTPESVKGGPLPYSVMNCPFKPEVALASYGEVKSLADAMKLKFEPDAKELTRLAKEKAAATAAAHKANAGERATKDKAKDDISKAALEKISNTNPNNNFSKGYGYVPSNNKLKNIDSVDSATNTAANKQTASLASDITNPNSKLPSLTNLNPSTKAVITGAVSGSLAQPYKAANEYILPTSGVISSTFGRRVHPVRGTVHNHSGVDIAAPAGTPVYAAQSGVITRKAYSKTYGNVVYVNHEDGTQTRYAHLSGFNRNIQLKQAVPQGELLGYVGNTGVGTGNHLHYQHKDGQVQSAPNINPFDAMGAKGEHLNKKGEVVDRTIISALGDSSEDIDKSIEGVETLPEAAVKTPSAISAMPMAPRKESVLDETAVLANKQSEQNIVEEAKQYNATTNVKVNPEVKVNNTVDTRPIGDSVAKLGDKNTEIHNGILETNKLLTRLLDKPAAVVEQTVSQTQAEAKAGNKAVVSEKTMVGKRPQVIPSVLDYS